MATLQKSPTGGSHTLLDTCHGDAIEVHWAPGSPANLPTWRWRHTSRPSGCESLGSSQGGSLGESHPQLSSKQLCTLTLTYPLRRRRRFWAGESAPWVKSLLHQLGVGAFRTYSQRWVCDTSNPGLIPAPGLLPVGGVLLLVCNPSLIPAWGGGRWSLAPGQPEWVSSK